MIRVLLADDHAIVRQGLRTLLAGQPDLTVVGEATDGEEVLLRLADTPCDVLILDLSLPKTSGLELLRRIRALSLPAPVHILILTMYPEDQLAAHLLSQGASAYLCKSRSPAELLAALREVARGGRYVTQALEDLPAAPVLPHERLTPREYQAFVLLISGKTVSEVAHALDLSLPTVSNHVARIRDKLGAASTGDIILYAHRVGLLR